MYNQIFTLFVAAMSGVYAIPLSTEYGVPNKPFEKYEVPNKPFEVYGPPTKNSLILDEFRNPTTKITPLPVTEKIITPEVKPEKGIPVTVILTKPTSPEGGKIQEEVVVPPKTQVRIFDEKNQYSVGFQEDNGTEVKEQGKLISTDNGWEYVIAKTGSYKYTSPEGQLIDVNWIADEKGFRILSSTA